MAGAVSKAEKIATPDASRHPLLQHFKNPANPTILKATTRPEIWDYRDSAGGNFVVGVSAGGTIIGVSRQIEHQRGRAIQSVAGGLTAPTRRRRRSRRAPNA